MTVTTNDDQHRRRASDPWEYLENTVDPVVNFQNIVLDRQVLAPRQPHQTRLSDLAPQDDRSLLTTHTFTVRFSSDTHNNLLSVYDGGSK